MFRDVSKMFSVHTTGHVWPVMSVRNRAQFVSSVFNQYFRSGRITSTREFFLFDLGAGILFSHAKPPQHHKQTWIAPQGRPHAAGAQHSSKSNFRTFWYDRMFYGFTVWIDHLKFCNSRNLITLHKEFLKKVSNRTWLKWNINDLFFF